MNRLNDSYFQFRSQTLLMNPLPTMNQAYAMIVNDEGQKIMIFFFTGLLGASPPISCDPTTFYSKTSTHGH